MAAQAGRQGCTEARTVSEQPRLYAAGFNAHGQLDESTSDDLRSFRTMKMEKIGEDVRILFTCWSSTVLLVGDHLIGKGHQTFRQRLDSSVARTLTDAFGNVDGMLGALDGAGNMYLLESEGGVRNGRLVCQNREASPSLGHLALAGNGKLAVTFRQASDGRSCHLMAFDCFADFVGWFLDPNDVQSDAEDQHFVIQGRPAQLIASTATFLLLTEGGEIYSWGDPRYQSLGRSIAGNDAPPPGRPGVVDALGGLKIQKVVSGGWMSAALSEDGAMYLWGGGMPGTDQNITCLRKAGAGEIALVELLCTGDEPLDVLDVALGDGHVAAVAEGNRLFVVGDNQNGQLGLNRDKPFLEDWAEVTGIPHIRNVVCGARSTFVSAGENMTTLNS